MFSFFCFWVEPITGWFEFKLYTRPRFMKVNQFPAATWQISIGHFQITFGLFFKASPGAHLFIWKLAFIHMQMKTNFRMERWAPRLALKKRPKVIRKWPIHPVTKITLYHKIIRYLDRHFDNGFIVPPICIPEHHFIYRQFVLVEWKEWISHLTITGIYSTRHYPMEVLRGSYQFFHNFYCPSSFLFPSISCIPFQKNGEDEQYWQFLSNNSYPSTGQKLHLNNNSFDGQRMSSYNSN